MKRFKPLKASVLIPLIFLVLFFGVVRPLWQREAPPQELSYTAFMDKLRSGKVLSVLLKSRRIEIEATDGARYVAQAVDDPGLVSELLRQRIEFRAMSPEQPASWEPLLNVWLPIVLVTGFVALYVKRTQGGGLLGFGKSQAKLLEDGVVKVSFADVAGQEEAKEEVREMVDFLRDPSKFQRLGGRIPRGALMVGPPGTGKTLLARAIAGEAGVPFFAMSGSGFVEMYVGVGASRVRDLFARAKAKAPCIVFIDEIDAVGRRRGQGGQPSGNTESEQTLNQLLVEMDGFEGTEGVIVLAATNRADVLDPALLRPGRFDRQVNIGLPDIQGRAQILKVHMKNLPLADDVEMGCLARGTPGFSGADLANLVNESALLAARQGRERVGMAQFEQAKDKLLMGAERVSLGMSEAERRLTACHEAGHAIVGWLMPEHDPLYKVSIMPRGRALGVTLFLPERDQYSASLDKLEGRIAALLAGRAAEELLFGRGKVTTGAQNDIERATSLARSMVGKWGFSERLGLQACIADPDSGAETGPVSERTARLIDAEVKAFLDRGYQVAQDVLNANLDTLRAMSEALLCYETLDLAQIEDLMAGREARPPAGWT